MKKQLLFIACACLSLGVSAKKHVEKADTGFVFTTAKENPITSIKNQNQSGTCWCFSTLSFFESELLRMGKANMTFAKCSSYIKPWKTVQPKPSVHTAMFRSRKEEVSTT